MKLGIWLSNRGGSPLQGGLERGLSEVGHQVEQYRSGAGYDLVLMFNQTAHGAGYEYSSFPEGMPIAFVDSAEYGYFKRLPGVVQQCVNAFAPGSLTHDTKDRGQQEKLRRWIEGRSFPYFLREFSKYIDFPASYHPIDYPLYHLSICHDRPDRDEYLRRSLDLFVSWGASHPWRMAITDALRIAHTKAEIRVLEDGVIPRMPQGEYFERTRAAKCSVSFDGYGSGSFRMTEVLVRTLLLQGPLSIRTRAPLVDGDTCLEYDVRSDGETFLGTNIVQVLHDALREPERAYGVYAAGYEHCMEYLTERATAQYVMETVEAHDWAKPTPLDLT